MSQTLFTPILVSGIDARTYLQGQLTCDIDHLTSSNALLACCNSAQGRVQAVLTLIERPEGIVIFVVPEIAELTIQRLRKYVLRAKVKIEDASQHWQALALLASELAAANCELLASPAAHRAYANRSLIRWHDTQVERYLLLDSEPMAISLEPSEFLLADIHAGLPHVYPATHESFVAQMLNLDALGGISFEKGCYTGQEIIARAHFRGAVKRRMFRFAAECAPPPPGTRVMSNGEHAGEVVQAVINNTGCELLAVVSLVHADLALTLAEAGISLAKRPLPYSSQMS